MFHEIRKLMRPGWLMIALILIAVAFMLPPNVNAQSDGYDCGTYGAGDFGSECDAVDTTVPPAAPIAPTEAMSSADATPSLLPRLSLPPSDGENQNIPATDRVVLNAYDEYVDATGKLLTIRLSQSIYFTIGDVQHTITLKTVTDEFIILTIASTPTDVKIIKGQSVDYDASGDGNPDIRISYTEFAAVALADVTFKQLMPSPAELKTVEAQPSWLWFIMIISVILSVIIVITMREKKLQD